MPIFCCSAAVHSNIQKQIYKIKFGVVKPVRLNLSERNKKQG